MKVVILAGGVGSRISEESFARPKPLIEIGEKPIIWHIMKIYSEYGFNDFVICCGYKGYLIKEYFVNYSLHTTDINVNVRSNRITVLKKKTEPWNVTLVDTGINSLTGDRIKKIQPYINNDDFCLTYGDGLTSANIKDVLKFHKKNKKLATVLAVKPSGRFGAMDISRNQVKKFIEKPKGEGGWINGGFFILNKKIFNYLKSSNCTWEKEPLENLANDGQLSAYTYEGFWYAMDTLRDKNYLEQLWNLKKAPWKTWKDE